MSTEVVALVVILFLLLFSSAPIAMALGLTIVVVQRPPLTGDQVFDSVAGLLEYIQRSGIRS